MIRLSTIITYLLTMDIVKHLNFLIKNPDIAECTDIERCLEAIKEHPLFIFLINKDLHKSEEFCYRAVQINIQNYYEIKNPSKRVHDLFVESLSKENLNVFPSWKIKITDPIARKVCELSQCKLYLLSLNRYIEEWDTFVSSNLDLVTKCNFLPSSAYEACVRKLADEPKEEIALKYAKLIPYLDMSEEQIRDFYTKHPDELVDININSRNFRNVATGEFLKKLKEEMTNYDEALEQSLSTNCMAIEFVQDQTEELCWQALKADPYAISYIENPTYEMLKYAAKTDARYYIDEEHYTEELGYFMIDLYGYEAIHSIPKKVLPNEYYESILDKFPSAIRYIENPSRDMLEMAIKALPNVIMHLKNVPHDLIDLALSLNGYVISNVRNPTLAQLEIAFKSKWDIFCIIIYGFF